MPAWPNLGRRTAGLTPVLPRATSGTRNRINSNYSTWQNQLEERTVALEVTNQTAQEQAVRSRQLDARQDQVQRDEERHRPGA